MGGKGREVLFDRLIVTDIGEDRVKNRQCSAVCRNWNARLGHQCQQAQSFERDGFAAGVRPSDDQFVIRALEFDTDGNDAATFEIEISFEQGMARFP